jgi:hypothetical protein
MTDRTFFIDRTILFRIFGRDPLAVRKFEEMQETLATTADATTANVEATLAARDGTYVTLSANAELPNERVLAVGPGLQLDTSVEGKVTLRANVYSENGWPVELVAQGATSLVLPTLGILATTGGTETFANKTLNAPRLSGLVNAADDAAAAAAGVPVGGMYRTGSDLKVRVA